MTYELSVVIPVYNVEKYIGQCLDSIVNQTLGIDKIEVIIVNDCTLDNSMEIVEKFAHKYPSFKIINHSVNKGLGEARNTGLKHVTTDYVTFMDSDDFISENAYENSLKKIKESNADLLIFNWEFFTEGYVEPPSIHQPNFKEDKIINDLNEASNLIFLTSAWNKIYHKNLFKYLNYPTGLYEDNYVSSLVLIKSSKIYLNAESTYYYRKNQESITNKLNITNSFDLSNCIKSLFDLAENYPDYGKIINQLSIKFIHDVLFWVYYYNWSIKDEISMIKKLQESINPITKDELKLYQSLIYSHFPFYEEDVLDLTNYSANEFLAIYKYFKSNNNFNPISNLYVDTGVGFNEENKLAIDFIPNKINKLTFDLSQFDNIKALRFDPVEGAFSKVKIYNNIEILSSNADKISDSEYQVFTTTDPNYIINYNSSKILEIECDIKILSNEDIADILSIEKNKLINFTKKPKKNIRKLFSFKRI